MTLPQKWVHQTKGNMSRVETTYNEIVNYDNINKIVTVLRYTFDYTLNGDRGCVGFEFKILTEEEYKKNYKLYYDNSYRELNSKFRETLNLSKNEFFTSDCIRCGRIFDEEFKGNTNIHLSEIIRKFESEL